MTKPNDISGTNTAPRQSKKITVALEECRDLALMGQHYGLARLIEYAHESGTTHAVPAVMEHYGRLADVASPRSASSVGHLEWHAAARQLTDALGEVAA